MSTHKGNPPGPAITPEIVAPVLSRRQEGVIVALLSTPTIKDAAALAGVSESTVWRLMQREDFQKRFKKAQDQAVDSALAALQGAATRAIESLMRNLTCGLPSAEVQAAKIIIDFTFKARDQFDHGPRIKQLEAALEARERADRQQDGTEEEDED
jgi:hypothetical protein